MPRSILHADVDAFFVAVECLKRPELRGKPVIVGGALQRGVVSSASYEARKFGVHSGMPMAQAVRLCPQAVVCPVRHRTYGTYARRIIEIFQKYTPDVEPISIDEAYLDLSGTELLHKASAPVIAKRIVCEVYDTLHLSISGGLSTSKVVSKIASSLHKPHRLTIVPPGAEQRFLAPLPVEWLPGVGKKTLPHFRSEGIRTIGDLAAHTKEAFVRRFGKGMAYLWHWAHGEDDRTVESEAREAKSISHEQTFEKDYSDRNALQNALRDLLTKTLHALRADDRVARTVELKIRYPNFHTITVQKTIEPSNFDGDFFPVAKQLFQNKVPAGTPIRLLGVGVKNCMREKQLPLLRDDERKRKLVQALDALRKKYGIKIIHYGAASSG